MSAPQPTAPEALQRIAEDLAEEATRGADLAEDLAGQLQELLRRPRRPSRLRSPDP